MNDDSKRIRVLAVDDHPILRQGIAGLIADESDMTLVAEAANGREAIQQFRAHRLAGKIGRLFAMRDHSRSALALGVDRQFQTRLAGVDAFRITL